MTLVDTNVLMYAAGRPHPHKSSCERNVPSDLILLGVMLLDGDGFTSCRELRAEPSLEDVPALFLTARSEEADKVSDSRSAQTTTTPNRSALANWWPASRPTCGGKARLRGTAAGAASF